VESDSCQHIFCPTPEVQLNHFLHHTPKLGILVEMAQFIMKLLLKQRILVVYHDFHCVCCYEILDSKTSFTLLVGHFTSDSATLTFTAAKI